MNAETASILEVIRRLRTAGGRGAVQHVVRALYRRLDVASTEFTIRPEDLADSSRLSKWTSATGGGRSLPEHIGFVCTPPGAGSGGHTTLFRMVEGLEDRGHPCTLFLYDPHGGDLARREAVIRQHWPTLGASVSNVNEGFEGVDALVASSWESAHVVAAATTGPAARLYFVQDFEPYFYPRGSLYTYAEDSYRFGLRIIALGDMVASEISKLGVPFEVAPFGCDVDTYYLTNRGPRSGIIFYAKPDNDRRGYLLGKSALQLFHARHPEQEIHVYGDPVPDWTIPVTRHHRLSPMQLNELYNQSLGGLAMSFTNISLVAEEMLAAGAIPVVNDSPLARADLPNTEVVWARPTAGELAEALSRLVESHGEGLRADRASNQVRAGWGPAQAVVAGVIEDELARLSPRLSSLGGSTSQRVETQHPHSGADHP